jgi:drug/metabolite transporter (DMT)-like permease
MFYLVLSILASTLILLIFRIFPKYHVDTFQAIVFNYLIAFGVGFVLYGNEWKTDNLTFNTWPIYALLVGLLFISLFLLMGKSTQVNGLGVTSVTVKMSLAIPVILAIYLYQEALTFQKVLGILTAVLGVFLITYRKHKEVQLESNSNMIFLVILFVGSGILDALLNFVEKKVLGDFSPALFSAVSFGIAGSIGILILVFSILTGKNKFRFRNVLAGIILGVPNYFSIYFLLMAVRNQDMDDSITYALNNVGIVIFSFLLGLLLFKEKLTITRFLGVVCAIVAIITLVF